MNDREEARRVAYEVIHPNTAKYTPGDWPIPQSPFKTRDAIASAMSKLTEKTWHISRGHVGGFGEKALLINDCDEQVIYIWRDSSGGWHPEHKVGANWLPDLDLLDRLIEASKLQEFDAEPAIGNHTAAEVAYMRHPD